MDDQSQLTSFNQSDSFFLKKMGQSRPLFVYFRYFLETISLIQIEKSVDGVLGNRTRGHRMVGADETTELWRIKPHLLLKAIIQTVLMNTIIRKTVDRI